MQEHPLDTTFSSITLWDEWEEAFEKELDGGRVEFIKTLLYHALPKLDLPYPRFYWCPEEKKRVLRLLSLCYKEKKFPDWGRDDVRKYRREIRDQASKILMTRFFRQEIWRENEKVYSRALFDPEVFEASWCYLSCSSNFSLLGNHIRELRQEFVRRFYEKSLAGNKEGLDEHRQVVFEALQSTAQAWCIWKQRDDHPEFLAQLEKIAFSLSQYQLGRHFDYPPSNVEEVIGGAHKGPELEAATILFLLRTWREQDTRFREIAHAREQQEEAERQERLLRERS